MAVIRTVRPAQLVCKEVASVLDGPNRLDQLVAKLVGLPELRNAEVGAKVITKWLAMENVKPTSAEAFVEKYKAAKQ